MYVNKYNTIWNTTFHNTILQRKTNFHHIVFPPLYILLELYISF